MQSRQLFWTGFGLVWKIDRRTVKEFTNTDKISARGERGEREMGRWGDGEADRRGQKCARVRNFEDRKAEMQTCSTVASSAGGTQSRSWGVPATVRFGQPSRESSGVLH